jgi:hypothetical protein
MRMTKFRSGLVAVFAGAMLALAVMFTTVSLSTQTVRAEGGVWKCPPPPPGCNFLECFHRLNGAHDCKYMAFENGANCASTDQCEWTPLLD